MMGQLDPDMSRVLIVEDDKTLRRATVEVFKALGYETLTAEDGVTALQILQGGNAVELIFSDMVLPKGIDGAELASKARAMNPNVKILLASGYPFDKIETRGEISEENFISKPYRISQLEEKLQNLKIE